MPKALVLGNGNLLITLDKRAQVKDFYFPFVGLENQAGSFYTHRIGVWVDGQFNWFNDADWEIHINYQEDSLVGNIEAINNRLQVRIEFTDAVYNEKNIFIRKAVIYNLAATGRTIKIFFHQQFEMYESHRGDSGYFEPNRNVIFHYKGSRVCLVNAMVGNQSFTEYSIGNFGIEGKEGTFRDAEDGHLSNNPVEHGMVDSVLGLTVKCEANSSVPVHYWLAIGQTVGETDLLNEYVLEKTPDYLIGTTRDYWKAWGSLQPLHFGSLDQEIHQVYKKSLLIMRTHTDNRGGILASGDTDILHLGRDAYAYVWPRDGAIIAMAFNLAGEPHLTKRFLEFCADIISKEGYFMHRYRPDKSLGSSWHAWIRDGKPELPIQEDETAMIIIALWQYYVLEKDVEFIEGVYNDLIKRAAEFMILHRDVKTGLPKPSYDLWEAKFGIHTYTAATVYAALVAAASFAKLLGKVDPEARFMAAAHEIQAAVLKNLYDPAEGYFYKAIYVQEDGSIIIDKTIDASSAYGIFKYEVLPITDQRLAKAVQKTQEKLTNFGATGGMARFEHDMYFTVDESKVGNPWFITTLWDAQYKIAKAESGAELEEPKQILKWAVEHALVSGIMSEQLHPDYGDHISASPLSWSHAEYVLTVIQYIKKLEELGLCAECNNKLALQQ